MPAVTYFSPAGSPGRPRARPESGQFSKGKKARGKEGKWKKGKVERERRKKGKEEGSNTPVGQRPGELDN